MTILRIQNYHKDWENLYDVLGDKILRWCCGDLDVAQTVWLKLYKHICKYNVNKCIYSWVKTIASNTFKDEMRRKNRFQTEEIDEQRDLVATPFPEDLASRNEVNQIVRECLEQLSEENKKYGDLLSMYSSGMKLADIANIKEVPVGTVKSQLFYARKALKKKLLAFEYFKDLERKNTK